MSEIINIAAYSLFFLIIFYTSVFHFLRYLHMFQLNSYSASEQLKWIGENFSEIIRRHAMTFFVALFSFLAYFIMRGVMYKGDIVGTLKIDVFDLIMYNFLILAGRLLENKRDAKKKLVFTPRTIRLCVTSGIIYAAGFVLSLIFLVKNALYLPALCLLQISTVFIPIIANLINSPVEKSINKHYIDDAKRIIDAMPNLITIGITGSYGKTSAKFYLNKLLSSKYNVLMTPESFNTTMGVVKTVRSSLKATHEIFICEMGAKKVGEIKEICDIVHPKHSMITSIGPQHLETFKSMDNIVKTKFEIADCVNYGTVFLNYDNEYIKNHNINKNVVSYGFGEDCDYRADNVSISVDGMTFSVYHAKTSAQFSTKLIGKHNVQNILGAIAVSHSLGISFDELQASVQRLEPVPHRMEIIDKGSSVIIDDAFNSNPVGAKAALDALELMNGFKILITPGMVELGEKEYELNKIFGAQAAAVCDYVIAVGEKRATPIIEGLKEANYPIDKAFVAKDLNEALAKAETLKTDGLKKIILLENDLPDNY